MGNTDRTLPAARIIRVVAVSVCTALVASLFTAAPSAANAVLPTTWKSPTEPVFDDRVSTSVVAMSADGSMATALWIYETSVFCNNIVTASATIEGNTADWGDEVVLTDCVPGEDNGGPAIAVSADGTKAVAVWEKQQPGGTTAEARSKSATITGNQGDWNTDPNGFQLIQDVGGTSPNADVAVSADGSTAAVSFNTNNAPGPQAIGTKVVRINGSDADWEDVAVEYASDVSQEVQSRSSIALSANGGIAVTNFARNDGSFPSMFAAAATITDGALPADPPNVNWHPDEKITGLSGSGNFDSPGIALSSDGAKTTAVWTSQQGSTRKVEAASATLTGNDADWEGTPNLLATNSSMNYSAPSLGLSSNGSRATVVWSDLSGSPVVSASSGVITGNAGDWDDAEPITDDGAKGRNPSVGLSADGNQATAVWPDATTPRIMSSSADIAGKTAVWSEPNDLVRSNTNQDNQPGLAVSADGSRATAVFGSEGNNSLLSASAKRTYRISFAAHGGSGSMTNVTGNSPAALPANRFVRSGYRFVGWNTKENGSGVSYANKATYPFRSGGILYAQWALPKTQIAVNNCVKNSALPPIKPRGIRVLSAAQCKTNAGKWVGTRINARAVKGDVRIARLVCRFNGRNHPTKATGYIDGSRYCPRGKLVVRTFGTKSLITVHWFAPANSEFKAFRKSRTYRT